MLQTIESVAKSDYRSKEIILVDNASTDSSLSLAASVYPELRFVRSEENRGYAGGMNLGATVAKGEFILFCSNDAVLQVNCLSRLMKTMISSTKFGVVGPRNLNEDGTWQSDAEMMIPLFYSIDVTSNKERAVDWVNGAVLLVRSELFRKLEGFDESYFMYSEDVDFCWRVRRAYYEVIFNPQAEVVHALSHSARRVSQASKRELRTRQDVNRLRTFMKDAPLWMLIPTLTWLQLTLGVRWAISRVKGNSVFESIVAYRWGLKHLGEYLRRRYSS